MASLGAWVDKDGKVGRQRYPDEHGVWDFDEDDYLLYALLCDPINCAELLGEDPTNHEYAQMFTVRDYQYPLFRMGDPHVGHNYAGAACARSVGKTESIKWRAVSHTFRRIRQNLLVTAPELIHLLPLTDAIEEKIRSTRLTREFLDTRGAGSTGFKHRPFEAGFADGTKIIGRIPRLTGTGVKGQHQPDLIIDEAQDYPEKGWVEVHETVMKDTVDLDGNPDFTYHFYGVHSGVRDTGFDKRAGGGNNDQAFHIVTVTALQRPGWSNAEKRAAKAAYGGETASDYRRNIYGEAGGATSPFFVTARLMACLDQDPDSHYNLTEYVYQNIKVERFDEAGLLMSEMLDLPSGVRNVWGGCDVGLNESPTVITLFSEQKVSGVMRLKLIRRFQLERMRARQIREAMYAIGWHFGGELRGMGMDITGLGLPMWQEMEDDESCPPHLMDVSQGYFFNAKVPVAVDKEVVTEDAGGRLRDHLGAAVTEEHDPLTGITRFVTSLPMIEASTRYLREFVDQTILLLPFDQEIARDMLGESTQRVRRIAGLKNKPNAFHILDSMRTMAMVYKAGDIAEQLAYESQTPVLDVAF